MKLGSKIVAIKSVDKFPSGKGLTYFKTEEFIDFIENKHIPSLKKKLWCCVAARVKHENLVLSNKLIKVNLPL